MRRDVLSFNSWRSRRHV